MKNKNYIVLFSDSLRVLEDKVNKKILDGYIPQGPITVVLNTYNEHFFYQSMILKTKNNF